MESVGSATNPAVVGARGSIASLPAAFAALDQAAIPYTLRKGSSLADPLAPGAEVDIALPAAMVAAADAVLRPAGFHRLSSAASPGHRFYVAFERGVWLKIDAKITKGRFQAVSDWWASMLTHRLVRALALRRPLGLRRLGPVIAVLGLDGAGKGTIIASLQDRITTGLAVIYLGWRPRTPRPASAPPTRQAGALREAAYVVYWALRYWRSLLPGYLAAWSGHIVLCDRHPIETLAVHPRTTRLGALMDRILLGRLMPWPDAVLLLDASAPTLAARKHEDAVPALERRRRAYREVFGGAGATIISTEQPVEHSTAQAAAAVWSALRARRRW